MVRHIRASAPGRVCLFGEHQDYLGLPVIAAAINLRIGVDAEPSDAHGIAVSLPDTGGSLVIDTGAAQRYEGERDYLRACISVLKRRGLTWRTGYRADIHGDIPINAGVSSSSAMVVMWLRFLIGAADLDVHIEPEELARLGHAAEVVEFGEPGGMMDHFCAAIGGVLAIDTRAPFHCRRLPVELRGIVLGNSLQPKATIETLGRTRADVIEGIRLARERYPDFALETTPIDVVDDLLTKLPTDPGRRLRANLVNRDITVIAMKTLGRGDEAAIGRLLLDHHAQLRDGLDLSTEKIERMLEAALSAGALGGKVNGSGGGGCMFAYCPGKEEAVAEAILREGGKPYVVSVDDGARLEVEDED